VDRARRQGGVLLSPLGAFGSPVLAQTFSDGDFHEADWEAYKIRYLSNQLVETNATGTFSVRQVPTGGSPGSFREITINYVNDDVGVANLQKSAVWSPATQGAIYRLSYSIHRLLAGIEINSRAGSDRSRAGCRC